MTLTRDFLRRFLEPLAWSDILDRPTRKSPQSARAQAAAWRDFVCRAEELGLLEWDQPSTTWRLTEDGMRQVLDEAESA